MVLDYAHPYRCLGKAAHPGHASSVQSVCSSDLVSDSGYASDVPRSQSENSVDDGFSASQSSSTYSVALTPDDGDAASSVAPCSDSYQYSREIESWLIAQRAEIDKPSAIPAAQRQHPRRTAPICGSVASTLRPLPCTLARQEDRTEGFVALLVGFTAGLVEAIWPLSACPPRVDPRFYGGGVLPLKTFIQETLRRSKTSYSTLQVALYYLVLLKDHLPKRDLTQEQPKGEDCRAMQCGRRMFLAALILASKYLQDRNYSTRAWSKISGLRTVEINQNEIQYLSAIDWKLHVPKEKFDRWSRIVLRLSALPSKGSAAFGRCNNLAQAIGWTNLVYRITPDLPEDFGEYETGLLTPPVSPPSDVFEPNVRNDAHEVQPSVAKSSSALASPAWSESSSMSRASVPTLPPMPRPQNLPTPQTTPQTTPLSRFSATPAVSALKSFPRCAASLMAMSNVKRECMARATIERCPPPQPLLHGQPPSCLGGRAQMLRRTSPTRSVSSLGSSPESMVADTFTPSTRSRSSSISSTTSFAFRNCLRLDRKSTPPSDNDGSEATATWQGYSLTKCSSLEPNSVLTDDVGDILRLSHAKTLPTLSENTPLDPSKSSGLYHQAWNQSTTAFGHEVMPTKLSQGSHRGWDSLTDLEAAGVLCLLPQNLSRSVSAVLCPSSSEATPKGLQRRKTDVDLRKSHKRTYSKVTDALHQEVRKQLQSTAEEPLEIIDDPDQVYEGDNLSPAYKAEQLPFSDWARAKRPVPVQGMGHNKRFASESYVSAPQRASLFLRENTTPMQQVM